MTDIDIVCADEADFLTRRIGNLEGIRELGNAVVAALDAAGIGHSREPRIHTESGNLSIRVDGVGSRGGWFDVWSSGSLHLYRTDAEGPGKVKSIGGGFTIEPGLGKQEFVVYEVHAWTTRAEYRWHGEHLKAVEGTPEGVLAQVVADLKDFLAGGSGI